ncbi:MAG TPA: radical SAM protein, partial [Geobacteraceae bacterium]
MDLIDSFGRTINYLRLSVTDRCNLRCQYCMPASGIAKVRHNDILSFEELLLIAECAVGLGIEKIRVTGGEPLIRRGIMSFLARLA